MSRIPDSLPILAYFESSDNFLISPLEYGEVLAVKCPKIVRGPRAAGRDVLVGRALDF